MSGVLDDASSIAGYDSAGMLAAIPRLSDQLRDG